MYIDLSNIEHNLIKTVVNITSLPKPKKSVWHSWFEPQQRRPPNLRPVRQTVRRDNILSDCISLPIISVSNMRSLIPKINNFKLDIKEREISVALLSEVWEKHKGKKKSLN